MTSVTCIIYKQRSHGIHWFIDYFTYLFIYLLKSIYLSVSSWHKPRREHYMTQEYFSNYHNEMTQTMYSGNGDPLGVHISDTAAVGHDAGDDAVADWIPLSEFYGKINNRKNSGGGGKKFMSAFRQLKQKYLSRAENLTEDDSSGLLADVMSDDDQGNCVR